MDINELEKWILTNEGKQWTDNQKSGLLNKNSELLAALKETNGKLAESDQRSTAAAEELAGERAALSSLLVDQELSRLLKETHVFEMLIPTVTKELKDRHAITVKADGLKRTPFGIVKGKDGTETETSLNGIVSAWAETPDGLQSRYNTNTGRRRYR
jgi:hypothetical protein